MRRIRTDIDEQKTPKVAVVGGGIMGASAAWHLARAGADVTLVVRASDTRNEATPYSFGWVGTGASLLSDNVPAFTRHLHAVREFARVQRELGRFPIAVRGALIWWETEDATATFLAEQIAAGVRMEAMFQRDLSSREPGLAVRPPLAAWAPDDFALEPAQLASRFIEAATGLIRHLLYGSGLELRPTFGGGLSSAADFPDNGEEELPAALARRTADSVAELLGLTAPPIVLSVTASQRPMPIGGEPLHSFTGGVEGLYALVAHPGVTFAPLLGRLATEDIMNA